MIEPGLYVGSVMHRRSRPVRRRFEYRVFWLILDLDRLRETASGLRLMSLERFNLLSFYARDHADGRDGSLRDKITSLATAGGFAADGPMLLMTMPRVLGYVFNPISVFFCHDARNRMTAIVWEVSNTFGGRHSYVIGVDDPEASVLRQRCRKELHVSPFIGMEIDYHFRVVLPRRPIDHRHCRSRSRRALDVGGNDRGLPPAHGSDVARGFRPRAVRNGESNGGHPLGGAASMAERRALPAGAAGRRKVDRPPFGQPEPAPRKSPAMLNPASVTLDSRPRSAAR